MREIKFRGIPLFGKGFVYGHYRNYICEGKIIHEITSNENGTTRYNVKEETIGQYTGLTDKNGTEIYEGDILKTKYKDKYIVKFGVVDIECEPPYFSNKVCGFYLERVTLNKNFDHFDMAEFMEIIGNIYENPELLEKGD